MDLPLLVVKKGEERRMRAGHLWVYGNEVDADETPLYGFAAGQPGLVRAKAGTALGTAYVNPHTLICARLVTRLRSPGRRRGPPVPRSSPTPGDPEALLPRGVMSARPTVSLVLGSGGARGLAHIGIIDRPREGRRGPRAVAEARPSMT